MATASNEGKAIDCGKMNRRNFSRRRKSTTAMLGVSVGVAGHLLMTTPLSFLSTVHDPHHHYHHNHHG